MPGVSGLSISIHARSHHDAPTYDGLAVLERWLSLLQQIVHIRSLTVTLLHEVSRMPTDPRLQTAIDGVKAAVAKEAGEIKTNLDTVIAQIQAGSDPTDAISQLNDISTAIDNLSNVVVVPPSPPTP